MSESEDEFTDTKTAAAKSAYNKIYDEAKLNGDFRTMSAAQQVVFMNDAERLETMASNWAHPDLEVKADNSIESHVLAWRPDEVKAENLNSFEMTYRRKKIAIKYTNLKFNAKFKFRSTRHHQYH
jgi:hypothetical protein